MEAGVMGAEQRPESGRGGAEESEVHLRTSTLGTGRTFCDSGLRWKAIEESLWRLCGDGQGGSIDTI